MKQGDDERRITVELSGSAARSGHAFNPRDAVGGYLDDEDPPRHLIVTTDGVYPAE